MGEWLQNLAVGVAVLIGLVSPATGLRLEPAALKTPQAVLVEARVSGALTPQAREYLLAGNSLTLLWEFRWGDTVVTKARTITFHAWDADFEVTDQDSVTLSTKDEAQAVESWQALEPRLLGSRDVLAPNLGSPLRIKAFLSGNLQSLWGYKTLETELLFRTWLEIPQ